MAVPFKSTVFTGGSFAASGSNGHSSAGLLIYSASRSSGGLLPAGDLASVGKDVFLYVSGAVGSRGTAVPGATLVGGDLVISGTAYYSDGTALGSGGGATYLASTTAGSVYTTGSFAFVGNEVGVDAPSDKGADVNFYVKGTQGSRGTATAGTALFSGDLYVSGTVYSNEFKSTIISSSIIYSSGSTLFGDSADDTHTFIGTITGSSDMLLTGSLTVKGTVTLPGTVYLTGPGGQNIIHDAGSGNLSLSSLNGNVYVEGTLFNGNDVAVAGDLQVNGGDLTSPATTMNVFNTVQYINLGGITELRMGAVSSLTTVYGSLQVDGNTTLGNSSADRTYVSGTLTAPAISGSLTRLASGLSYLEAGSNVTITSQSNGQVTISSTGGGSPSYFSSTTNGFIFATGSLALVASEGVTAASAKGSDVYLYVSGSKSNRGTSQGRVALFGGNIVVSGSVYTSGTLYIGQAGAYISYDQPVSNPTLLVNSPGYMGVTVNNDYSNLAYGSLYNYSYADNSVAFPGGGTNAFYVLNTNDADNTKYLLKITDPADNFTPTIDFGSPISATSFFNFYGEMYVRETVRAASTIEAAVLTASYGITGSLTRLPDGRTYLAAGSNVTITSESNGQVTISSTGGSGSPAGSNTYVQFNDSGSFGASSLFSFEKATNTLSIQNVTLGSNIDSQAADSRWYLKNNSADALSFWDGTSGSRRFQINMGDSQERFIAYDGSGFAAGTDKDLEIVHDGTDSYIKNATGKLYLSGSTSGVFVTGSTGLIIADGVQPSLAVRASSDATNQGVFYQEVGGDTYISNQKNSGKFFSSVKTSAGVAVRYLRAIPNAVNYNTIVSFVQGLHDFFDPQANTTDVNFYVGGKPGSKGTSGQRGTALFAGDMVISGSTHMQNGGSITGSFSIQGSIIPSADSTYTLGTDTQRWGHVYTGDLHLRNERGDWTILEEPDYLCVINNKTGKKYKMMLQPID